MLGISTRAHCALRHPKPFHIAGANVNGWLTEADPTTCLTLGRMGRQPRGDGGRQCWPRPTGAPPSGPTRSLNSEHNLIRLGSEFRKLVRPPGKSRTKATSKLPSRGCECRIAFQPVTGSALHWRTHLHPGRAVSRRSAGSSPHFQPAGYSSPDPRACSGRLARSARPPNRRALARAQRRTPPATTAPIEGWPSPQAPSRGIRVSCTFNG
jgi:hypothetical protein